LQCSPPALKHANTTGSHSSSVIELTDDEDFPSLPAIKVELLSGEAPQWPADFHAINIVDFFETHRENTDV